MRTKIRFKTRISVLLVIFLIFFIAVISQSAIINIGNQAPNFSLKSLKGDTVNLSDYKEKKAIVLGLFHICKPCKDQTEELIKVYNSLKGKDIEIIGINTAGNSEKEVNEFLNTISEPINFPYLTDQSKTMEKNYSLKVTPNIYIINKKGVVVFKGSSIDSTTIENELKKIL